MNAYADVTTIASANYLDIESTRLDDLKTGLRKILEACSREIDSYVDRAFFCWEGVRYYDGAGKFFKFDDDILSITTFKLDEDGDGTFESTLDAEDYVLYPLNAYPKEYAKPSAQGDYGSFASNIPKGVEIDGVFGYGDGRSATPYKDSGDEVEDNPLAADATVVTVNDADNFGAGQTIRMEDEQAYIEDVNTSTEKLTVRRGVNGTTAAAHVQNTTIYIYEYPADIVEVCLIESVRAASAGNWLEVSGNPETVVFSVKKGFHPKSVESLDRFLKMGW